MTTTQKFPSLENLLLQPAQVVDRFAAGTVARLEAAVRLDNFVLRHPGQQLQRVNVLRVDASEPALGVEQAEKLVGGGGTNVFGENLAD